MTRSRWPASTCRSPRCASWRDREPATDGCRPANGHDFTDRFPSIGATAGRAARQSGSLARLWPLERQRSRPAFAAPLVIGAVVVLLTLLISAAAFAMSAPSGL